MSLPMNGAVNTPGPRKPRANNRPYPGTASPSQPRSRNGSSGPQQVSDSEREHHRRPSSAATPVQVAYAGARFQASPAASSLPAPNFASKSVPGSAGGSSLQARLDQEGNISDSGQPTPVSRSNVPITAPLPIRGDDSTPLDIFFQADKAEKARKASVPMLSPFSNGPPNPVAGAADPARASAPPLHHYRQHSNGSRDHIFPLDLENGSSFGSNTPPYSTPSSTHSVPDLRTQTNPGYDETFEHEHMKRMEQAQHLKAMLWATPQSSNRSLDKQTPLDAAFASFSRTEGSPSPSNRSASSSANPSREQTPRLQPQPDQQSSLHYGNRNLSPMFRASQGTPSRPSSGLRKEVSSESPDRGYLPVLEQSPATPTAKKPQTLLDPDSFDRVSTSDVSASPQSRSTREQRSKRGGRGSKFNKRGRASPQNSSGNSPPNSAPPPVSSNASNHGRIPSAGFELAAKPPQPPSNSAAIARSFSVPNIENRPYPAYSPQPQNNKEMQEGIMRLLNMNLNGSSNSTGVHS